MAERRFKSGDVVRLKSGGPKMAVVDYGKYRFGDDESYQCKWFDAKNNMTVNTFTEEEFTGTHVRRHCIALSNELQPAMRMVGIRVHAGRAYSVGPARCDRASLKTPSPSNMVRRYRRARFEVHPSR